MSRIEHNADLSEVLEIADRSIAGFPGSIETKSRAPATTSGAGPTAEPTTAELVASLDRQTEAITRLAEARAAEVKAAPATSSTAAGVPAMPATVRSRIEKARALRELRQTSEANARPGRRDVLAEEKMGRINGAMDAHDADEIARLRRENADLRKKAARPPGPSHAAGSPLLAQRNAAFGLYRKAINNYLRTGQETIGGRHLKELQAACLQIDAKAFNASVNAEGGYFVQPETDTGPLERMLADLSPLRRVATVRTISSASYKKRVNLRGSTARWVTETTATTTDTTPSYAELEFPAMTILAEPELTQEALEDASIDVEMELAESSQEDFAEKESEAFISGDGDKKPKGLVSANNTYIASASWAWGKVGFMLSGADGAFAGTGPGDVILKTPLEIKQAFRQQASWLMNRSTIGSARAIRASDGHYVWTEGDVSKGVPNTLAGYVVNEDEQMPDIATGAHAIAFGDWRRAYMIVDRLGFQAFRNPYINPPYIRYHMRKRVGGGIQRYDAFRTIKFSAS